MNYALIFAGGVGSRMGSNIPKQFLRVDHKPIIIHVIEKFSAHEDIDGIVVVCKQDYITECESYIKEFNIHKVLAVIAGGNTGQASICCGINYLKETVSRHPEQDIVLVHDGVRPLIDHDLLTRSIQCVKQNGNSIAVSPAIETVIRIDAQGHIIDTVDRSQCRNAKAPQCFFLADIWAVHQQALQDGVTTIDSATLMSHYGHQLYTTDCKAENIKITTPNDYYMFKGMYEARLKPN